jgi:hypothetical protein
VRAWSWLVPDPLPDEFEPANDLGRGMVEKLVCRVQDQVSRNRRFKVALNLSVKSGLSRFSLFVDLPLDAA